MLRDDYYIHVHVQYDCLVPSIWHGHAEERGEFNSGCLSTSTLLYTTHLGGMSGRRSLAGHTPDRSLFSCTSCEPQDTTGTP